MKTPLDEFCEKMEEMMGKGCGEFPGEEFRRNFRALAAALFSRMNLVSREEFDAQSLALARAMERMEALEKQIRELRTAEKKKKGQAESGSADASAATPEKNPPRE